MKSSVREHRGGGGAEVDVAEEGAEMPAAS